MVEVLLAENDKVIQALLLNGLDKPLNIGGHIGTTGQESLDSDALRFEDLVELLREFRVRVVDEVGRHLLLLGELHADVSGLLGDPSGIWVRRG